MYDSIRRLEVLNKGPQKDLKTDTYARVQETLKAERLNGRTSE